MNENTNFVNFLKGPKSHYQNIVEKDGNTLYFCEDTREIYLGDVKYTPNDIKVYDTRNDALIDGFFTSVIQSELNGIHPICYVVEDTAFYIHNNMGTIRVNANVQPNLAIEVDDPMNPNPAFVKNVPWRSTYTLNNTPIGTSQAIVYGNLNSHGQAFYNQRLDAEYAIKVPEIHSVCNGNISYEKGELYELTLNNHSYKVRLIRFNNSIYLCDENIFIDGTMSIMLFPFMATAIFHKSEDDSITINEAPGTIIKGYFSLSYTLFPNNILLNSSLVAPEPSSFNLTPIWEKAPELTTGKAYKLIFDAGEGGIIEGYNTSRVTFSIDNGDYYKEVLKKLPKAFRPVETFSDDEDSHFEVHTFDNWYCEKYNFTLYEDDFNTGYFAVNEDITLNATWQSTRYNVDCPNPTFEITPSYHGEGTSYDGILRFGCEGEYQDEDGNRIVVNGTFLEDYNSEDYIEAYCYCGQSYSLVLEKSMRIYDEYGNLNDWWTIAREAPLLMADGYIHTGWYCEQYDYTLSLDDYFAIGNIAYWNLKRYIETKHPMGADKLPVVEWDTINGYGISNKPFGIDFTLDNNTTITIPGTNMNGQMLTFDSCHRTVSSWCGCLYHDWSPDCEEYIEPSQMSKFYEDNTFIDDVTIHFNGRQWETSYDEETEISTYKFYTPSNPLKIGKMYLCKIENTLYMCDEVFNGKTIPENHKFLFTITPSAKDENKYHFDIIDFDYKVLEDYLYINHDIPSDYIIDWDGASYSLAIMYITGKLGKYTINKINPVYLSDASDVTVEDIEKMWKELNTWGTITHMEDGSIVLECPHPYISDIDEEWEFSFDESYTHIDLTFDEQTTFEDNCDYLVIVDYDGNENQCGNEVAGTTLTIGGSYVKIKFHSDGSVEHYGFKVTITPTSYEVE